VIAAIAEQQRDEPAQAQPTAAREHDGQGEKRMELAAFRVAFPGLVDVARVEQEEVE
jgi:hypothetical protein